MVVQMPRSIEKTAENVYSLTRGQMLLHNSSKLLVYESEELFKEFILKMREKRLEELTKLGLSHKEVYAKVDMEFKLAKYEVPRAYTENIDLIAYLNPGDPEWHGPITGCVEPLFFFLGETRMGSLLDPTVKNSLPRDKNYDSLDGICRFVEGETIDSLIEMGYRKELEPIRTDLSKEVNPSDRSIEAIEVCKKKLKEARDDQNELKKLFGTGKKIPEYMEITSMMIRASASYLDRDFNYGFAQIKGMSAVDIFVKSGLYIKKFEKLISPQESEDANKHIDMLKIYMSSEDEHPIREIKPVLKQTEELLLKIGKNYNITSLVLIGEGISKQYKQIESQPPKLRIEEIGDFNPVTYIMSLQTLLDDARMCLNRYSIKNE
ncbi:MAG: hypothetical protein A2Y81_03435 [Nitrospirae bacterium RBG_13_43_8]|nr:MAG: hypothetical protein A2Y81_03435 [Nitrospirae bacterium RBG_13_43_8]